MGDHVYIKVSPTKGVQRFGIKGKLAPRYIGPYEIKENVLNSYKILNDSLSHLQSANYFLFTHTEFTEDFIYQIIFHLSLIHIFFPLYIIYLPNRFMNLF